MSSLEKFWQVEFLNNDARSWAIALVTFLVTLIVLPVVKGFISARRRHWAERQDSNAPQLRAPHSAHHAIDLTGLLIEQTGKLFIWSVAIYLGSRDLTFPPKVERFLTIG